MAAEKTVDPMKVLAATALAGITFAEPRAKRETDPGAVVRNKFAAAIQMQLACLEADLAGTSYTPQKQRGGEMKAVRFSRWFYQHGSEFRIEPVYSYKPVFPKALVAPSMEGVRDVLRKLLEATTQGQLDAVLLPLKRSGPPPKKA